jgi:hypothetical protein
MHVMPLVFAEDELLTTGQLAERVAALEKEVAELKSRLEPSAVAQRRWWLEDAGRFADDPSFDEIVELGRRYRQSLRPKPRKRHK